MSFDNIAAALARLGSAAAEAAQSIKLVFEAVEIAAAEAEEKQREAKSELKELLNEIMELFNDYYDDEMKLFDCFDYEPRERFPVFNEKKSRRIKNKDRFSRWFVMVAHNNARE